MALSYDDALKQLTGPDAPFELITEEVDGRPLRNFKNRQRSLREKIAVAALHGEQDCLVQGERRISYAEFAKLVWGAGHQLRDDFGMQRGDRFAVLAYNSPDWLMSLFGATSVGGVGVGLNGWWASEEIEYGLNDSGSRYLVVDERLYPRVEKLLSKIPSLEQVFYIGEHPPAGTESIQRLLVSRDDVPNDPIDEGDPFVILYTSGTTGRPKGCITTHRGTLAQVTGIVMTGVISLLTGAGAAIGDIQQKGEQSQRAALLTSPLFHVAGLHCAVCAAITAGWRLVFAEGKFEPEKIMSLIQEERINTWGAIPTMFHRLVHSDKVTEYDLSSLTAVSFGGAPTPPETMEKARQVLPIAPTFTNLYGLTETHGVATANAGKDLMGRQTSAGRPLPFMDIKIIDEAGNPCPPGALGEILFYGPTITPGYWKREEATVETVRNGWLHTGDLGYIDEDGFLFVVDRAKDMILRGGENVYCVEIENCLADHPEIDEAAIVGVPDPEMGERVKAIVKRIPGSELDVKGVQAHVANRMANFKVPEFVEFVDKPLPRNPAGKLLKNLFRGEGKVSFDLDALD